MLGIRLTFNNETTSKWLSDGTTDWFWPAVEKARIPIYFFAPGQTFKLGPIAERYPQLTLIIDHMGLTQSMLVTPAPNRSAMPISGRAASSRNLRMPQQSSVSRISGVGSSSSTGRSPRRAASCPRRLSATSYIGGAQEKTGQAEQAEARHARAHRREDVIEVCSEPDRGSATDDRDRRAGDSAGNRPSHAPHPLPSAVERVADPEKSEERPNGPKVGRPDRQNCRIAAE